MPQLPQQQDSEVTYAQLLQAQQPQQEVSYSGNTSWREDDLIYLIENANNTQWSVRQLAFEKIEEFIDGQLQKESEKEVLSQAMVNKIIELHIDHISDTHFKVIAACSESLILLLEYKKQEIFKYLDKLIPKLLQNLTDSKQNVSQKANFILNQIQRLYHADELILPIQKYLEQANKLANKVCALEVMSLLVKESENYFTTFSNIRSTVQIISHLIYENQSSKQMVLPSLGIVIALTEINKYQTIYSILSLAN